MFDFVFGPIRVPRAAAALVLATVTLLAAGVLELRGLVPSGRSPMVHEVPGAAEHSASNRSAGNRGLPVVPAQYAPPVGRSDPTGSLSPELRSGKHGSLKSALRGE